MAAYVKIILKFRFILVRITQNTCRYIDCKQRNKYNSLLKLIKLNYLINQYIKLQHKNTKICFNDKYNRLIILNKNKMTIHIVIIMILNAVNYWSHMCLLFKLNQCFQKLVSRALPVLFYHFIIFRSSFYFNNKHYFTLISIFY